MCGFLQGGREHRGVRPETLGRRECSEPQPRKWPRERPEREAGTPRTDGPTPWPAAAVRTSMDPGHLGAGVGSLGETGQGRGPRPWSQGPTPGLRHACTRGISLQAGTALSIGGHPRVANGAPPCPSSVPSRACPLRSGGPGHTRVCGFKPGAWKRPRLDGPPWRDP